MIFQAAKSMDKNKKYLRCPSKFDGYYTLGPVIGTVIWPVGRIDNYELPDWKYDTLLYKLTLYVAQYS